MKTLRKIFDNMHCKYQGEDDTGAVISEPDKLWRWITKHFVPKNSNLLDAQVSDDLGGRNCSTCNNWDAYTTGIDEYPQCTGIAYCKKGHWENGRPNDDYTKCFIDCVDWEKNDSPNSR